MKILGLDVSSSTIGICILQVDDGYNIVPQLITYYKPPNKENILDSMYETKQFITKLINEYKPTHIGIEQIIPYMEGASSANTIIKLTSFNRMCAMVAYEHLNYPPELFNVLTWRHGIKLTKQLPAKEQIPQLVSKHLKIKFPYIYKQYKRKTNKKTLALETYDQADAVGIALYYTFLLIGKIKKKKI